MEIGIDENLGGYLPEHLEFVDTNGDTAAIGDMIDKATLFMLVYYDCPGLCLPLMSEIASLVPRVDLIPGKDYQIISLSFDHREDHVLAADKKKDFMDAIDGRMAPDAWRFLTGDSASIKELADSIGFYYRMEGDYYVHPGAIVFISPTGKITRYLFGTSFMPFDLKMGAIEATDEKVTPTIAKILKFCFYYDPQGEGYVLNVTRISAIVILVLVAVFVLAISLKPKKKQQIRKG